MIEKANDQAELEYCIRIISRFDKLVADRSVYDAHCQEIAQRVYPSHSNLFTGGGDSNSAKGEKRNTYMVDATAAVALPRFASIIDSILTPRGSVWQKVSTDNKYLLKDRKVREYFEEVTRILFAYRYNSQANFSSQNHLNFMSLGGYGGNCMFTDRLRKESGGIRYKSVHLSEVYWDEDHQGMVDTVFRRIPMKLRQIKQRWPDAKIPAELDTPNNADKDFKVIHCVEPRADHDPSRIDYRGKPFTSDYILREAKICLEKSGYDSFPYSISRYEQAPGEVTGRSPIMIALPAIKTLNEQKKTVLKQGQRAVDLTLLAHDDGVVGEFSMKPGAINFGGVSAEGRPLVHALPTGNVQLGKDLMDDERAIINDVLLISLFQILVDSPNMSATEVLERVKEKGMLISPTMGRIETEYLGTMGDRELDVLREQRLLPPMPQALIEAQGEYSFVYDSPFSRMQKAEQASGIMRTIESTLAVVNVTQDPAPLDHFDFDTIVPEIAEINGVPLRWMKSLEKVQQIREGRAEAQQNQQMIEAAPAAASVAKTMEGTAKK